MSGLDLGRLAGPNFKDLAGFAERQSVGKGWSSLAHNAALDTH
jgi:hypothetical protein